LSIGRLKIRRLFSRCSTATSGSLNRFIAVTN